MIITSICVAKFMALGEKFSSLLLYMSAAASASVVSDSVWPHRWQPTRLPRPWDSPGKNTGVGCHFLLQCMKVKSESEVAQSCPTLSDPMDCSTPGSSVHGISQKHWSGLPSPSPEDLPNPGIKPRVSCTAGRLFAVWATREPSTRNILH